MNKISSPSYEETVVQELRDDPEYAATYLNVVAEEGSQEELLIALGRVAKAFGGIPKIAAKADLNAQAVYRALSATGNPELSSLMALLKAMDIRLAFQPTS